MELLRAQSDRSAWLWLCEGREETRMGRRARMWVGGAASLCAMERIASYGTVAFGKKDCNFAEGRRHLSVCRHVMGLRCLSVI